MPATPILEPHQADARKRVLKITKALEAELGLDGWLDIKHIFDPGYDGDTTIDTDGSPSVYRTTAITTAQWKYRYATIRWYLPTAAQQDDDTLALIAIHEYIHVLLAPLTSPHHKSMAADLEEFVTESIARVIAKARGMEGVR